MVSAHSKDAPNDLSHPKNPWRRQWSESVWHVAPESSLSFSVQKRLYGEFFLVFLVLPLLVRWQADVLRPWAIMVIIAIALSCALALWEEGKLGWKTLLHIPNGWRIHLRRMLLLFAIGAPLALGGVAWASESALFYLPRHQPLIWLTLIWTYTFFSVSAQEFVFRVFLFHRYRSLFPSRALLILASAATFSWAHALYGNSLALAISFVGGLMFSFSYMQTGSWLLVVFEHALWGNWLFTVGLGRYFGIEGN